MSKQLSAGFTLLEVLIAMAITAFVALIATTSLSRVLDGVESLRETADRTYEVNRAWMIISRDLRHLAERPVRDEFGQIEPAMAGGMLARFPLSFTRAGWHNPNAHPRSNLQRVNYRLEDDALWRDSYPVLDRAADTEPYSVLLLDGVEDMQLAFLGSLEALQLQPGTAVLDTSNWVTNWVVDVGAPDAELKSPIGVEISLQLEGWGEMRRLYALPPL
ncbi:MAG: type II secretion system minor pseudopilin GspJ [Halioglobus sp.]|nr:type II secretion system minor pseudopilin GspJ [Halioglobus sp.]